MPLHDGQDGMLHLAAAPPRPKHHVEPISAWHEDAELRCSIRRVYGYRYRCSTHGTGPKRATWAAAREDLREHRAECS